MLLALVIILCSTLKSLAVYHMYKINKNNPRSPFNCISVSSFMRNSQYSRWGLLLCLLKRALNFLYQSLSYFSCLQGFCLVWFLNNCSTFAKAFIDLSTPGNSPLFFFFNAPDLWIALWAWGTAPCCGWITDCSGFIYFSKLTWTVLNLGAVRYNFCRRKAVIFADSLCLGIVH